MRNTLNQRQYDPYALNTPSGNLFFVENVDNFECYLLENLTGNFNVIGGLQINTGTVLYANSTNEIEEGNGVFNSSSAVASGNNNVVINSDDSLVSGTRTTIIGGRNNQIADADDAAVLFGAQAVLQGHTGAVIIGDGNNSRAKNSVTHNSLTIDFESGAFFQNAVHVKGNFFATGDVSIFDSDLNIAAANSGTVSGNLQVLGTAYQTGSKLQNEQDLVDSSGSLLAIITGASGAAISETDATGLLLHNRLESTGAFLSNYVDKGNHQTIKGPKFFNQITGQRLNIGATGRSIPSAYDSAGVSGDFSFDHEYLYIATGNNAWSRMYITGW